MVVRMGVFLSAVGSISADPLAFSGPFPIRNAYAARHDSQWMDMKQHSDI